MRSLALLFCAGDALENGGMRHPAHLHTASGHVPCAPPTRRTTHAGITLTCSFIDPMASGIMAMHGTAWPAARGLSRPHFSAPPQRRSLTMHLCRCAPARISMPFDGSLLSRGHLLVYAQRDALPGWAGSMGLTLLLSCWWGRAALCPCLFPPLFAVLLPLHPTNLVTLTITGECCMPFFS